MQLFFKFYSDLLSTKKEVTSPKNKLYRDPDTTTENGVGLNTNNGQYLLPQSLELNHELNQSSLLNQYRNDNKNNEISNRTYDLTNEMQAQSKIDQPKAVASGPKFTSSSTNAIQTLSNIDQSKATAESGFTSSPANNDDDKMDVDDVIIDDVIKHRNDVIGGVDDEFINNNDVTTKAKAIVLNKKISVETTGHENNVMEDTRKLWKTTNVIGSNQSSIVSFYYNDSKYTSRENINKNKNNNASIKSIINYKNNKNNSINIITSNINSNNIVQPLKSLLPLVHANNELNKKSIQDTKVANNGDPTCTYSNVLRNATLKGNLNSGKFTDRGEMDDINQCARLCCMLKACDLAFMLESKCFTVQCKSKALCEPVQARSARFSPLICYILVKAAPG